MSTRPLTYNRATELLRRPGHVLVEMKTHTKHGRQFFIVPGGPVEDHIAKKILDHPLCRVVDDGLFPGIPQTYALRGGHHVVAA